MSFIFYVQLKEENVQVGQEDVKVEDYNVQIRQEDVQVECVGTVG